MVATATVVAVAAGAGDEATGAGVVAATTGAGALAAGGATAAAAATGWDFASTGVALASAAGSIMATTAPVPISSPTFTSTSRTVPAKGAGTSIVALSDSSVTRPWSLVTISPTFTSNSITGTPWSLPISGTRASINCDMRPACFMRGRYCGKKKPPGRGRGENGVATAVALEALSAFGGSDQRSAIAGACHRAGEIPESRQGCPGG